MIVWVDPAGKPKKVSVNADDILEARRKQVDKVAEDSNLLAEALKSMNAHVARMESAHFSNPTTALVVQDVSAFWKAVEDLLRAYQGRLFTTDEIWDYHTFRDTLYSAFDEAARRSEEYWAARDQEEEALTVGVPEDHELRLADYLETVAGRSEYDRLYVLRMLLLMLDDIRKENERTQNFARTPKDIELSSALIEVNKLKNNLERRYKDRQDAINAGVTLESIKGMKNTTSTEANLLRIVAKHATRKQVEDGERRTRAELKGLVKERAIAKVHEEITQNKGERLQRNTEKFREIEAQYGVRGSRWFTVLNKATEKFVLMNVDTLEVHKSNTAICESCDTVLQSFELRCTHCDAPRSRANFRFFNELGNHS
jgi:hypothetical protein